MNQQLFYAEMIEWLYQNQENSMKKVLLAAVVALGMFTSLNADDGATLYEKCVICHGKAGEKVALGKSKIIKDMSQADFIASLKGYQDGSYGGAQKGLMTAQVKSLDDAQIEAIAKHIVK
jgi:cytochrome c